MSNHFIDRTSIVLAELDRARRLLPNFNDPRDRGSVLDYIAELEAWLEREASATAHTAGQDGPSLAGLN